MATTDHELFMFSRSIHIISHSIHIIPSLMIFLLLAFVLFPRAHVDSGISETKNEWFNFFDWHSTKNANKRK